jgi:hypothetical protein
VFGTDGQPKAWPAFYDRLHCSLERVKQQGYLEPSKLMQLMHEHVMVGTSETFRAIKQHILRNATRTRSRLRSGARSDNPVAPEFTKAQVITVLGEMLLREQFELAMDIYGSKEQACLLSWT